MKPILESTEKPVLGRRRRLAWLIGVPILLMLTGLIVTWIWVSRSVENRLAAAIAEANRDDPYWQINDLMAHREAVPDAENSAIVLAGVYQTLRENWPGRPKAAGEQIRTRTEVEDVYEQMKEMECDVRLDDPGAELLKLELANHQEALLLAKTVANYARGRHELTIGPTLIDTPLSETARARDAARLLHVDAAIRAHDGDLDGAIESCRAILGVARSIGDEPFSISQLVRIAIGDVASYSTERVLGQGEPSDEVLAKIQAEFETERKQPLSLYGIKGERATLTELIRLVGIGEVPIPALTRTSNNDSDLSRTWKNMSYAGKLWFRSQRAIAIEWMNELIDIVKKPSHEQALLCASWDKEMRRVKTSPLGPYTAPLPMLLLAGKTAFVQAQTRHEGELGTTVLLIAAERHRRKTGRWPATIGAIDRSILPAAPLDPVTGRPYRMKQAEGRIVIYSIGADLKDEGGLYEPKKWQIGGGDDVGATGWDVDQRRRTTP